jgi:hypothetical protein
MPARDERLAVNEALFREMNDQAERQARPALADREHLVIVCECGDIECAERLRVPPSEYGAVRAHQARFIVAEGHVASEVEKVVAQNERYVVVEKIGRAGELAAELDSAE